jgi:enamine deaminase RidA (YjgF/YER057c/UK114 family)
MREMRLSNPPTIHKPLGYSHVAEIEKGKLIYIAGQVALDVNGALVGKDDYAAQVRQVFANVSAALSAVGATFHDVVKLNYYCVDTVDPDTQLTAVRTIRDGFVNREAPPVSTFVVVRRLVRPEWLIEVEAVAFIAVDSLGDAQRG